MGRALRQPKGHRCDRALRLRILRDELRRGGRAGAPTSPRGDGRKWERGGVKNLVLHITYCITYTRVSALAHEAQKQRVLPGGPLVVGIL